MTLPPKFLDHRCAPPWTLMELCLPAGCPSHITSFGLSGLQASSSLPSPLEGELLVPYPPLVPSPSAELDFSPQRRHPMPLAIIDGVLRDKTGLPTAQLVAGETHEGVSYGVGQEVKGADGIRGVWLGHLELQLPVGEARDGRGGMEVLGFT